MDVERRRNDQINESVDITVRDVDNDTLLIVRCYRNGVYMIASINHENTGTINDEYKWLTPDDVALGIAEILGQDNSPTIEKVIPWKGDREIPIGVIVITSNR